MLVINGIKNESFFNSLGRFNMFDDLFASLSRKNSVVLVAMSGNLLVINVLISFCDRFCMVVLFSWRVIESLKYMLNANLWVASSVWHASVSLFKLSISK